MLVSVIIPSDRPPREARATIEAALAQGLGHEVEVLVATSGADGWPADPRLRYVEVEDRNPALRRNLAAAQARGEILAFIDDDAIPEEGWIENALGHFRECKDVVAIGGPDPAPLDSSPAELISETLLATRWIGSGIACHEFRQEIFTVKAPHDVALVNLFVRRDAFERAAGFDETIGYIGEDTDLVSRLMKLGRVVHHGRVVVRHRRRPFPGPYLRQRFRYRMKTGALLVRGQGGYSKSGKVIGFLGAGLAFLGVTAVSPPAGILVAGVYVVTTTTLGIAFTRLSPLWWPVIPFAFALHHATYYAGLLTGILNGLGSPRELPEGS